MQLGLCSIARFCQSANIKMPQHYMFPISHLHRQCVVIIVFNTLADSPETEFVNMGRWSMRLCSQEEYLLKYFMAELEGRIHHVMS